MSEDFKVTLVEPRNPALHTVASVNPFDDKEADWEKREEEMIQLMKDRFGIGLASPQLGMGYRMFVMTCLLYTSPSPRDGLLSRMPSSA